MEETGIDPEAEIHPRQESAGVAEIEILREIMDAAASGVTG
jgi:hypothetical protein